MARYSALEGVDETVRKLTALRGQMRDDLVAAVESATERTEQRARALAPVGKRNGGQTRDAITTVYFDEGLTGSVFVAPVRDRRGLRPKNLPVWLEYGTRKMTNHPFLAAAGRESARAFEADSVRVVARAVKAAE